MRQLARISHRSSLAFALVVAVSACGDDAVEPTWPPQVEGTWAWVRSVERTTEEVRTPSGEGYNATLRLLVDASDRATGQYEYRKGGDIVASGRFGIAYEDAPGNDFIAWDPPFGAFHQQQWLSAWSDTLRMLDATTGGYEVTWVRAQ